MNVALRRFPDPVAAEEEREARRDKENKMLSSCEKVAHLHKVDICILFA